MTGTPTEATTGTSTETTTETPNVTPTGTSTETMTGTPTEATTRTSTETTTETPNVTPTETTTGTPTETKTGPPTETTTGTPNVTPTGTSTETMTGTPTEATTRTSTETTTETPNVTPTETTTGTPTETTTGPPTETTTGTPTVTPPGNTTGTSTETTTGTPPTNTSTTKTTTTTTTRPTSAPGHCASNPCPQDSTCEERVDGFTCTCQKGLIYDSNLKSCLEAKSFPNDLQLTKLTFKQGMEQRHSEEFKNASQEIVEALNKSLSSVPGYLGSTVLKLSELPARINGVSAEVDTFFSSTSSVTEDSVNVAVTKAINSSDGILSGGKISFKTLCSVDYCDNTTTKCNSSDGLATCSCKAEYVISTRMTRACIACPSGEKAVNSKKCERCSFGLSGFNCNEPYLLSVVVVSCILGTLSVSSFIAVIVIRFRKPKKTNHDKDEINMEFNKPVGIPRIPRANPNAGWQPSNLDTSDSGSRCALVTRDLSERTSNGFPRPKQMDSYDDYGEIRNYGSQFPSRSAYGAVSNVSRANRNPYYDPDEDTMHRY
ncbi:mucin-13b isoform X2 [Brachyhypopomus gauderio]